MVTPEFVGHTMAFITAESFAYFITEKWSDIALARWLPRDFLKVTALRIQKKRPRLPKQGTLDLWNLRRMNDTFEFLLAS